MAQNVSMTRKDVAMLVADGARLQVIAVTFDGGNFFVARLLQFDDVMHYASGVTVGRARACLGIGVSDHFFHRLAEHFASGTVGVRDALIFSNTNDAFLEVVQDNIFFQFRLLSGRFPVRFFGYGSTSLAPVVEVQSRRGWRSLLLYWPP